jgi:hypothetical protein
MRSQSIVAVLSLASAALALHADQFPIIAVGESDVRPLYLNPDHAHGVSSNSEQWKFDENPPGNATGNLIFDTVHSLLHYWPNTRYRNGAFLLHV